MQRGFDVTGAVLVAAALLIIVYAITQISIPGESFFEIVVLFGISLALTASFIFVERRISQPLIPLDIFHRHAQTGFQGTLHGAERDRVDRDASVLRTLRALVVQQGSQFVPAPGSTVHINPSYLAFLSNAQRISSTLFASGGNQPSLDFALNEVKGPGVSDAVLNIDGKQFVIPVEAKCAKEHLSKTQIAQAIDFAQDRYPKLIIRPVGVQEMKDGSLVLLEFTAAAHPDDNKIKQMRRYKLVPMSEVPLDKQQALP